MQQDQRTTTSSTASTSGSPTRASSSQQPHIGGRSSAGAAAAAAAASLQRTASSTETQVTLSVIIEYTPLQGSRVKRVVYENGELSKDQREWLTQYITKDLIQLQTLAMHIKMQEQQGGARSSQQQQGGHPNNTTVSSPPRAESNRGSYSLNGSPTGGQSPSSLPHQSTNAPYQQQQQQQLPQSSNTQNSNVGSTNELSDDSSSFIKVISLEQLHTTVVVMFFALDTSGGDESGGGGGGGFLSAAASGQAHMYAIAVALNDNKPIRLRLALPSIRDWMVHTHQHIISLAEVEYDDVVDSNGKHLDEEDCVAGVAAAGVVDVEQEWVVKLHELKTLIDLWTNQGFINRSDVDLDATIFAKPDWNPLKLYGVLTAALSHHRCIIRSKNERDVQVWLNTLALFYSDDRLLFSSKVCFLPDPLLLPDHPSQRHDVEDDAIIVSKGVVATGSPLQDQQRTYICAPDFNLQGTTAEVGQILQHVHHFRFAPVIIDVSRSLDDPCHFFPKDRQVKFTEVRERIFRRRISFKPPYTSIFLHDKSRPATLRSSALLAGICGRLRLIAHPSAVQAQAVGAGTNVASMATLNSAALQRPTVGVDNESLVSMKTVLGSVAQRGGEQQLGAPPAFLITPATSVDQMVDPASGFPYLPPAAFLAQQHQHQTESQKLTNICNAIAQWRRQLVLRTLSYYYYTVEFRFKTDSQSSFSPVMFREVADDAILQVAVDFFAQIQEQKEKHARNVLTEAFAW